MRRLTFVVLALVVVIFGFTTASADAPSTSQKRVGIPPPKNPHNTTTTTTTITRPVPPPTSTTTTSTTTTTLPPPTTTRFTVTLADTPMAPFHLRYGMRPDHNVELRWEYTGKTYPMEIGLLTCFYANGVPLCGDPLTYQRDVNDWYVIMLPQFFGGSIPYCVIVGVRVLFDDGQVSPLNQAGPVCQGAWR